MDVPTATSLDEIYPLESLLSQTSRWSKLLTEFHSTYGRSAEFVARSPGRVNLIGEHIDYSLYDVLPMAVTADILIAVAVIPLSGDEKPTLKLANLNPKFPAREFGLNDAADDVEIDPTQHEWSNYFKAGLRGVLGLLKEENKIDAAGKVSIYVVVDGNVPAGSGLSSSSAFTVCSSLALLTAYLPAGTAIDKTRLTQLAIVSERAVGVNGGGMDQSASVFSIKGDATYVSFVPSLTATPIPFPESDELVFIVAQTFVAADKHVSGPVGYNLRVVECSLAAAVLASIFGLGELAADASPLGTSLRSFQDAYFQKRESIADNHKTSRVDFLQQLENLYQFVDDYLPQEEGYSREEISSILGLSIPDLEAKYMTKFPVSADRFLLKQRAMHVFAEAARVIKFREMLSNHSAKNDADQASDDDTVLRGLGALMNESQDSCRDVYNCSCVELDELSQLAKDTGSYGSRLTGAGWGGCSVHLVPKDKVDAVKKAWEEKYYRKNWPDISDDRLAEAIVVSKPGSGSVVFKVEGDIA
jgi:galactokinase